MHNWEQIFRMEPYDKKCDVYSYALLLWELITGRDAWAETNVSAPPVMMLRDKVLAGVRPEIPPKTAPRLARLITKVS